MRQTCQKQATQKISNTDSSVKKKGLVLVAKRPIYQSSNTETPLHLLFIACSMKRKYVDFMTQFPLQFRLSFLFKDQIKFTNEIKLRLTIIYDENRFIFPLAFNL